MPISSVGMTPADIPEAPGMRAASMRRPVQLAITTAVASVLLAFTLALMWMTGLDWRVDQPEDPAVSVFLSVDTSSPLDEWSGFLVAIPLVSAALAGMGAFRRRPALIRLSAVPAAVTFAVTWALIISSYLWGGIHDEFNADGHAVSVTARPRPHIAATWPTALVLSAVALLAAGGAWWTLRRTRPRP